MSRKARITLHPAYKIGAISPRLYGSFLEPIGTMVNGTMYNPKHPTADEHGFRQDIIEALKNAPTPALRLPGGNFVSGWDWKDSIGPMEQRKAHLDLAWHQYIPNDVGHDEYLTWAEKIGTIPMYTLNLGTGSINDAIYCVEYTNMEGGTYWSDLRRKNGHEKPYGVKTWYLGNEMDGPWQIASWERDPRGYGIFANEVSKAIKWVDGSIETAVCASSSPFLSHYPDWDLDVLRECYESVDYLSLHHYHSAAPGDYKALLGGACYFEDYINTEIALADLMRAHYRSDKELMLSFDEYGAFPRPLNGIEPGLGPHAIYRAHYLFDPNRKYVRHDPDNMVERPFRVGDMPGALASAGVLLTFLRHADRVKIGCMTGGLGTLVSSNKEHLWKSAGHYMFTDLIKYGRGVSLKPSVDCETFDIQGYAIDTTSQYPTREGQPYVDVAAALDEEKGELNVFVVNRDWEAGTTVELDLSGFAGLRFLEHIRMFSDDPDACNTWEDPERIVPEVYTNAALEGGKLTAELKPLSWNVLRFQVK